MTGERYVCVHGHFYQPPRENPWLDAVEIQDEAAPFHDWNERIAAECYGPNAAARILDEQGFVKRIVNNYSLISFNFGATLLTWMERSAPAIYEGILAADRESRTRFSGHGSALAQVYNHLIMPLANDRDKRTQVMWGIQDFESRFGRRPEGMWLPETAVDTHTLEALAERGIAFTVLAPHQARRVRHIGGDWQDVDQATLDTSQPYLANLPSGRQINLFFYDGALSQAVAFEDVLSDGGEFARRLVDSVGQDTAVPRLAHIATDGETYGHHHRFGEMGLAYALDLIEARELAVLTNYGEFLEQHPPRSEVEIVEATSWSCAHGVERWRSDCGCNSGSHPGWNQAWRTPLREALDWLNNSLVSHFETAAPALLREPWSARDDYISLVLDRSPQNAEAFLSRHSTRWLDDDERARALKLLEVQRHAMLMFASCAWFFDDVSGIETQQALRHAARAIQLMRMLDREHIETEFVERLSAAKSNLPDQEDGALVYRRYVDPIKVDLQKLAAHYAAGSVFEDYDDDANIGAYHVRRAEFRVFESGRSLLAIGKARVNSTITHEALPFQFAVLHLGDQTLTGGLILSDDQELFSRLATEAQELFASGDFAGVIRFLDEAFVDGDVSLRSLFRDQQRRAVRVILTPVLEEAEAAYRHVYEEHISLIHFLPSIDFPVPNRLRYASEIALDLELGRRLASDDIDVARVASLLEEGKLAGVEFEPERLALIMRQTLERLATALAVSPEDLEALQRLQAAVEVLSILPFGVDLGGAQAAFFQTVQRLSQTEWSDSGPRAELRQRLTRVGETLKVRV